MNFTKYMSENKDVMVYINKYCIYFFYFTEERKNSKLEKKRASANAMSTTATETKKL